MDAGELRGRFLDYADARMNEIVERLGSQGRRALPGLAEGEPVEMALAAAARHDVAMIVVGGGAEPRTGLTGRSRWPVLVIPYSE